MFLFRCSFHPEQQRIAKERQLLEQQERQHNLELLGQWQKAAISLGKPADYVERIREVTADYQRGLPLSAKTIAARQKDLAAKPATDATSSARTRSGFQPMRCADFSYLWGGARVLKHGSVWGERLLVGGRSNLAFM